MTANVKLGAASVVVHNAEDVALMNRPRDPRLGNEAPASVYFLQSERLGFRHWSSEDMDLAMGLWGDPELTRLIGGPFSREQVRERLSCEIATMHAHGIQYWPIFLLGTGAHVGCCGLRPYRPAEGIHEVGIHLRKAYWGQGYAPEATHAVMTHAFKALGVKGLFAGHNPGNEASRRLLVKMGFRYVRDEYYPPTGLNHPSYILTAEEFPQTHR